LQTLHFTQAAEVWGWLGGIPASVSGVHHTTNTTTITSPCVETAVPSDNTKSVVTLWYKSWCWMELLVVEHLRCQL
jgi:hypothetical protein